MLKLFSNYPNVIVHYSTHMLTIQIDSIEIVVDYNLIAKYNKLIIDNITVHKYYSFHSTMHEEP